MHTEALKILLADDNMSNVELMRYILQRLGYSMEVASDGLQALERCREQNFDLVLMDIQMPVMDGLEATKHIRETNTHNKEQLKIVALTAANMASRDEECTDYGLDACIIKPFRVGDIEKCINQLFIPSGT